MMDDLRIADQLRLQYEGDINDKYTREKIVDKVSAYIDALIDSGAHCNRFKVVCDETNNPPLAVAAGELHVKILMAGPNEAMLRAVDESGIPYVWTRE